MNRSSAFNDSQVSSLADKLIEYGFSPLSDWRFVRENLVLRIVDQRFDGVELWLLCHDEKVRIDFLLEFYLTGDISLTKKFLRVKKDPGAFYFELLKQNVEDLKAFCKERSKLDKLINDNEMLSNQARKLLR